MSRGIKTVLAVAASAAISGYLYIQRGPRKVAPITELHKTPYWLCPDEVDPA